MHTEKKSELHRVVLRLAESGQFAQLTKYMLDIEARIQKLEAVAEAARDLQDSSYYSGYYDLDKALEELEKK